MNYSEFQLTKFARASRCTALALMTAAGLILAACVAAPTKPAGADAVRAELTRLQTDSNLANRAPVALQDAETAVREAETPTENVAEATQHVYVAERKVSIARAQAEKRYAEDQVKLLSEQRERSRLDARTQEAETAKSAAVSAKSQAEQAMAIAQQQQQAAVAARSETDALRQQLEDLQAKQTDRGLVMTLGDVLFATGRAELKSGAAARLDKLVGFMANYADRSVVVEGHTDSVGSSASNEALSQRRADTVKAYLTTKGVNPARVQAIGKGQTTPVASNADAAGRQQNRRVEVIISTPPR